MLASLPSSFPFIAIPGGRARLIELKLSPILFLQQKQQQKSFGFDFCNADKIPNLCFESSLLTFIISLSVITETMFTLHAFFLPRIDFRNALPCNRWVLLPGKKNFLVGDLDQKSDFYNLNYFFWSLRSMI